jgi:hypothetical protein
VKLFDRKFGSDFIGSVPLDPGVYRYFDSAGELVYVGKAIRLRRRLQQYRNAQRLKKHRKMREILKAASRIELTPCATHEEACLLELEWIRTLRPRFNIASAYSFLYPYIGVRTNAGILELFLTSRPDLLEGEAGISWHGAYRSRHWTREFFGALDDLLGYIAHKTPHTRRTVRKVPGVWVQQFRMVPQNLLREIELFLGGDPRNEFLSELVLALVENAGARSRRTAVQEGLQTCAKFWRRECERLAVARAHSGFTDYPVPQEKRDEIFLKFRLARAADRGLRR